MMNRLFHVAATVLAAGLLLAPMGAAAQEGQTPAPRVLPGEYDDDTLIAAGHEAFGETTEGLATAIEGILARFGKPNAYILGEEAGGAIFGGVRYGEGVLNTRGTRQLVFWQGPSFGWDLGGSGSRVMMLVYQLPSVDALMQRYTGIDGSAYLVGGLAVSTLAADAAYIVQVRTGVGARLGVNIGYLKFTPEPTWNPF